MPLKALSTLLSLPFHLLSLLNTIVTASLRFSFMSLSTLISSLFSFLLAVLSLPLKVLAPVLSVSLYLSKLLKNSTLLLFSSPIIRWACAVTILLFFISHLCRPKPCRCHCIRITAYGANGVKTPAITGCLHCDQSGHIIQKAEQVLSDLRAKRNSHGLNVGMGIGLSALGQVFTGPLLDVFTGNWVGIGYKAYRFTSVNAAVNQLKPFVADVLLARAPVQGCLCRGISLSGSKSGLCDISGGSKDDDAEKDEDSMEFDKDGLKEHFVEEFDQGSTLWEAVGSLLDVSPLG